MIEGKRKSKNVKPATEADKLGEKLQELELPTEFGKTLLRLSRKSLESGVTVLDADEIMSELGRSRYE